MAHVFEVLEIVGGDDVGGAEHYDFMEGKPDFIINYDIKQRMGDERRKTTRLQAPLFLPLGEGRKNLTDRREMFPVGKKTI